MNTHLTLAELKQLIDKFENTHEGDSRDLNRYLTIEEIELLLGKLTEDPTKGLSVRRPAARKPQVFRSRLSS